MRFVSLDQPLPRSLPRLEQAKVLTPVLLGDQLAKVAAHPNALRDAYHHCESNSVVSQLLQNAARLSRAQIKESAGQVLRVQQNSVYPAGQACLYHERGVVDTGHQWSTGGGFKKAESAIFL